MGPPTIDFLLFRVVFHFHDFLVGGFNPFEKYQSNWKSSPNRGQNNKYIWNHHLVMGERVNPPIKWPYKWVSGVFITRAFLQSSTPDRISVAHTSTSSLVTLTNHHMVCKQGTRNKTNMAMEVSPHFTKVDGVHRHQNRSSGVIWVAGKKLRFMMNKWQFWWWYGSFQWPLDNLSKKKQGLYGSQWTAPLGLGLQSPTFELFDP